MRTIILLFCSLVLVGCGFEARTDVPIDAAAIDAMVSDAAAVDATETDAAVTDAAAIDAAAIDAALIDAPAIDAPLVDAPLVDAQLIDAGPVVPEVVDMGISAGAPLSIALDGSYVYWTDGSNIYRKALDGTGGRLTVASHSLPSGNSGNAISEIDVDSTWVFFLANGQQPASGGSPPQLIRRVKDGSGTNEVMVTMPGGVPNQAGSRLHNITAKDPNYVYVTSAHYHAGGVFAILKSNPSLGSAVPNISGIGTYLDGYIGHLAVDGTALFVTGLERALTAEPAIVACTLPSCPTKTTIATFAEAGGTGASPASPAIAIDTNAVYWAQYPAGTAIASASRTGGGVSFLATLATGATDVVADDVDTYVRFIIPGATGSIRKVLKGQQGQTPVPVATNQVSPVALRMNATHVFWGDGTNKIWRIAR